MFTRLETQLCLETKLSIEVPAPTRELYNQSKNTSVFFVFSNQNLRQIGPGVHDLWSDKQIDKQRLQLYIYV